MEELKVQNHSYRRCEQILACHPELIVAVDGCGRLEYANREARRAMGAGDDDNFAAESFLELFSDESRQRFTKELRTAVLSTKQRKPNAKTQESGALQGTDAQAVPVAAQEDEEDETPAAAFELELELSQRDGAAVVELALSGRCCRDAAASAAHTHTTVVCAARKLSAVQPIKRSHTPPHPTATVAAPRRPSDATDESPPLKRARLEPHQHQLAALQSRGN